MKPNNLETAKQGRLFAGLTVGMAGVDRTIDVERLKPALANMFGLDAEDEKRIIVGNDATLLSLPMLEDDNKAGIAVVAGRLISTD